MADEDDAVALDRREAADERLVVAERAVAVQLDDVVGHRAQELERVRPPDVARQLDARPDRLAQRLLVDGSVRVHDARRPQPRMASASRSAPPSRPRPFVAPDAGMDEGSVAARGCR